MTFNNQIIKSKYITSGSTISMEQSLLSSNYITSRSTISMEQSLLSSNYITSRSALFVEQPLLPEIIENIIKKLLENPLYEHKCQNCGGTVELQYDKAIFICPYCGSHYALAPNRINDKG